MSDLLVTGIPRSGTTLVTAIIDGLEDSLALSEPDAHTQFIGPSTSSAEYVEFIRDDLSEVRRAVLKGEPIVDRRSKTGAVTTNYFKRVNGKIVNSSQTFNISRANLSPNFLLASKHNAHYTAVLPEILSLINIPVLAVIRHPVPTILSWRSLQLPISRGRLPAAEKYWDDLASWTRSDNDTLTIQVGIYELFCKRYLQYLDQIRLLRYEQLAENNNLLSEILGRPIKTPVEIKPNNRNHNYDLREIDVIQNSIAMNAPCAYKLYPTLDEF